MTREQLDTLQIGAKVIDTSGRTGEIVSVNNVKAIRFKVKGGMKYTFLHKVIESQIEEIK